MAGEHRGPTDSSPTDSGFTQADPTDVDTIDSGLTADRIEQPPASESANIAIAARPSTPADDVPTLFGTSGIRGPVGEELTAGLALDVGRALASTGADRVVLGRDARTTGRLLADALRSGVLECGADVIDLGMVSTPTVARSVVDEGADAGVIVTASHNPPADNGIKLWGPTGRSFGSERRRRIERTIHAVDFSFAPWDGIGERVKARQRALERHEDSLLRAARSRGDASTECSVIVDAGNGMGGITARALFEAGYQVQTLNGEPDGRFPGRASEPTPASCTALRALVAGSDADLGIAHDGDADRMLAVDETGRFIAGDQLLALFASEAAGPGDIITAPLNTSLAVADVVESVGADLVRTRVGDGYVAQRAVETGAVFGGEASGAWIWPQEAMFPDGPLAACKLAAFVAANGSLADTIDELPTYPIRRETVSLDATADAPDSARIISSVADRATRRFGSVDTLDGVRVTTNDGWFLVRASGTQPLIRLTAEASTEDRAAELRDRARTLVAEAMTQSESKSGVSGGEPQPDT